MPLARQQERVLRAGLFQARPDGREPVDDPEVRHAAHPLLDVVDDGAGVLGAGIVGGGNRQVRAPDRDASHDRPLAAVPVAAAAEDDDEPASGQRPQRSERALERVGRVGVIAEHDARHVGDPLHPARHLRRRREATHDLAQRPPESERARDGSQRIGHVEVSQQREGGFG